jgi:hypothetical protein
MIEQFQLRTINFRDTARAIFSKYETSTARVITLSSSYSLLAKLSIRQEDLFRQSLRCIENDLYRAAHVLAWAAFIDFYEEKLSTKNFKKLHAAYPTWSQYKTVDDLRENVAEYQLIESGRKLRLLTKNETKALQGLLNKRNECAHPSNYFPGLNDTLGYVSELIQRTRYLQTKNL